MGFGEIQFDYIRFPEPYPSPAAAGLPGHQGRGEARRARGVSQGGERAARQARRAHDGGHLRARDDGGRPARGGAVVGEGLAARGRRAADGVSVALSARRLGLAVPNAEPYKVLQHRDLARARARPEARHQEPEHVRPWLQAFTLGKPPYGPARDRGAEEGGVRLRLRRLGAVEPGVEVRRRSCRRSRRRSSLERRPSRRAITAVEV